MTDRTGLAPSISVLGGAVRRLSSLQITADTYIQISAESPNLTIYFTTDGTDPRPPGHRITHSASGQTHRYQAPFKLKSGLSRIVSAVAVSRGRLGAMATELFDVKDVPTYSPLSLEDDSSVVLSDVDSFMSTDTYTLNDRITRRPSPSTGDDVTEISVSDIYFSPRGKVYSRCPNTARELDTYFEVNHPRVFGGYRGQVWEEEEDGGWTSSESDVDSEVTNYFRMAQRQQNNRNLPHSRSHSRERRTSPYLKDDYPEFLTDNSQSHRTYDSPRSALRSHLSPASLLEDSKRTQFSHNNHRVYSPRVEAYTDRTYTLIDRKSAIVPEAAVPRSEKEDGRHTPLSDIGYKLGYKFASDDISDISDDVAERRLSARSESAKVIASRNGDKENRKVTREKPMPIRKKWSKTGLRETMATDDDVTSSASSISTCSGSSSSAKSDRKTAKKHHNQVVKKNAAAKVPVAMATPGGDHLQGSNPAMNFVNDSGTQINFWGVEPGEALQQMGTNLQTLMDRGQQPRADERRLISRTELSSENSTVDEVTDPVAPPVAKTEQVAQHSVVDKFRNFFGVGSKSKSKQKRGKKGQGDRGGDEPLEQIKQRCLEAGTLWEDPCFPACDESLYFQEKPAVWPVEWKRPHEICSDPLLFVGGASRFDVIQGVLGNCWLLAAVASLSSIENLLHQVVPPDQSFQKDYAGVFRFRFWQYGQWVDVCVDDRLPTKDGKLIYMHSRQTNEFWTPLLEKAYAKLNACYETLSGGLTSEAMTDFTGGVVEKFNFRDELPSNMFAIMLKACERGSLLGCSIDAAGGQMEEELDNGLLRGHAYSITAVRVFNGQNLHLDQVGTKTGSEDLVRVRNPWGNECEWQGAWSDKSKEWKNLSDRDKESLGLTFDHDGEFWMSFRDFSTHFQRVEICNIQPDSLGEADGPGKCWEYCIKKGSWKRKVNAGGCRNSPATFWTNPQFRVCIVDADDDDEEEVGTVIIGLMQQSRRRMRSQGYSNLTIGYEVYEISQGSESSPLDQQFFKLSQPVTSSPTYINTREVCGRHRLPPGQYCIIPTTFDADEEAEFIIRLFSEKPNELVEADEKTSVIQAKREAPVSSAANSHLRSEAETKFKEFGGEDLEVDAFELQKILNNVFTKDFKFGSFDINLCRSIVALEDTDQTGRLSLDEFLQVWNLLQAWKVTYKQYDKDHSGAFNSYELREALRAAGYKLSNSAFNTAVMRYSDKQGFIKFDDFVACVVRLKTLFDVFSNASDGESAKFSLDDFIKMALYS